LVFFDDILVYRSDKEQHKKHLSIVLNILRENQLKAKLTKCTFAQPQVEYLGHIISGQGVATDPSKIKYIIEWKQAQTMKQLRGFLGLTGHYRRFIKGYASICQPLYLALKKDNFNWGPEQMAAFEQLKQIMSRPPLLRLPNFSIPFILETYACKSGLGAVLMQEGRPIAFYTQCLGPKTNAQSVYEKEALAILHALKKWRHYFLGNKVIIKTDQQALKYLASQRLLEGIQHKLMLKLLEFTYEIEYKKGKENIVADALSQQFQDEDRDEEASKTLQCNAHTVVTIPTWLLDVQNSYTDDAHCLKLVLPPVHIN
jgi:hypothetical protein